MKRYDTFADGGEIEKPDGEWVRYEDAAAVEKERDILLCLLQVYGDAPDPDNMRSVADLAEKGNGFCAYHYTATWLRRIAEMGDWKKWP